VTTTVVNVRGVRSAAAAAACALLFVTACGDDDDGTATGGDEFCAGAERFDAAYEDFVSVIEEFMGEARRARESGGPDEEARAEALDDVLPGMAAWAEEAIQAVDDMTAAAEGDLRRDLETLQEYHRESLDAFVEAESVDDVEAAFTDAPDPPPGTVDRVRRIDDATQERCGVAFAHHQLEALIDATTDDSRPWPDVDVCSLLSAEALTEAGVVDMEGTTEDRPPTIEACEWGERYAVDGTYVRLGLWDPPFPQGQVFDEDLWEERGEVAGRTVYVESDQVREFTCNLSVDNGEYVVTATVDVSDAEGSDDTSCDVAEGLAANALSSLSSQE